MTFFAFFVFLVLQRVGELLLAKRNELEMKQRGAEEFGQAHYKYLVLLHVLFLLAVVIEGTSVGGILSPIWPILLLAFAGTQLLRVWAISSLGVYWNTKILVLPNVVLTPKGPYRFIRHPNYVVVVLEILLVPLLFQAYITAIVFSVLNVLILFIRIREEERALQLFTNYESSFQKTSRFIPKVD